MARFGGIDWRRTAAFTEDVNTQPGVWINLAGREARGCVAARDYERVRDDVIRALGEWRLPARCGGGAVVARALRREEANPGPHCARAPDVVLELAAPGGYGLALVPTPWSESGASVRTLAAGELAGGKGRGLNGVHTREGVWIHAGAGAPRGALAPARIPDAAPTILAALGLPFEALDGAALTRRAYTAEEEARVARQLRRIGYLE